MDTRCITFYGESKKYYMVVLFIFSAKKESWDGTGGREYGHFCETFSGCSTSINNYASNKLEKTVNQLVNLSRKPYTHIK